MKGRLLRLMLVWWSLLALTGNAAPWPDVAFAEVRAFAWKQDHHGPVVLPGGQVAPGALQPEGKLLSATQQERLLKAATRRFSQRPVSRCYVPHNAFIFYSKEGKPVASMEICFDCLGVRLWPEDAESDPDYVVLGEIFRELKLPFGSVESIEKFRAKTKPILGSSEPKPTE